MIFYVHHKVLFDSSQTLPVPNVLVKNLKYSQYNHFKTFKYANENIYIIEKSFLAYQNSIIKGKTIKKTKKTKQKINSKRLQQNNHNVKNILRKSIQNIECNIRLTVPY